MEYFCNSCFFVNNKNIIENEVDHKMVVFKLPKMTKKEIWELIQKQKLCRIAFNGIKYPYIAPFQYAVLNGSLYFHFTDYGKKMKLIEKNQNVCVEIEEYNKDLSEYKFVVLRGDLIIVNDKQERINALQKIVEEGEENLSPNFLAAHGFNIKEGWSSLKTRNKTLLIVKLEKIKEEIGLKSP